MVIINNPCNPTGAVFDYDSLKELCELAVEHNFLILSDEIYSRLVYDGATFYSIASFPGMKDHSIIISGFSKTFAMTGWRIGYLSTAKKSVFHNLLSDFHPGSPLRGNGHQAYQKRSC